MLSSLIKKNSFNEFSLNYLYNFSREHNLSFCLFKIPSSAKFFLSLSLKDLQFNSISQFKKKSLKPFFVFSPFDNKNKCFFFESNIIIDFSANKIFFSLGKQEKDLVGEISKKNFFKRNGVMNALQFHWKKKTLSSTPEIVYKKQVKQLVKIIKNPKSKLDKIVLNKTKFIPSQDNPIKIFGKLLTAYKNNALIYLVSSSKVGTWLGASPELMVEKSQKNFFKTFALAGTYWQRENNNSCKTQKNSLSLGNQPIWSEKEIIEQSFVSRYIINAFKKIRLREFEEIGPNNIIINNLVHLGTTFKVNLNKYYGKNLPWDMLQLLHPTSATCGYPMKNAFNLIRKTEKQKREFYAGFLGPVNFPFTSYRVVNNLNLFVNLRCGQLLKEGYALYAGAGITSNSIPTKEWLETEEKIKVLGRFIQLKK